jgi:signal transduction histidine kinase
MVSIIDTGPGINESNVGMIFEPFFTTRAEGMGMGLAICKEIIKSHEGKIWAENNPGKGAVFFFTVRFDSGERPTL